MTAPARGGDGDTEAFVVDSEATSWTSCLEIARVLGDDFDVFVNMLLLLKSTLQVLAPLGKLL